MTVDFDDMIQEMIAEAIPPEPTPEPTPAPDNDDPIEDLDSPPLTPIQVDNENDDVDNDDVDDEDSGEDDTSKRYFEFLKEYGVLSTPEDFEFDGTPEKLQEALDLTRDSLKESVAKHLWETLPEDFKPLLQYALSGGRSLEDYMDAYAQPDYSTLDLSDVENQRRVMYDYWANTSEYTPEKINRMISSLEKSGDLESEALETAQELNALIEERKATLIERAKEEEEARKAQVQEQTKKITTTIQALPNVDTARKNRLQTFMFTPVKYEEGYSTGLNRTISQITSNPEHFVQLADLLADYRPDQGFDFNRLKTQLKTETNKSFREQINSKLDSKSKVTGNTTKSIKDDFDWDN